ncbi:unnamed protein product [Prorocentrum cordatum]|uniref:Uncharacterized protein n=1 Tax=Prorocentrum cordatum TaxID=2364126 RepID=A0ABN9S300_9DINO|nr:unnamed protein product [Polarella glacialis]
MAQQSSLGICATERLPSGGRAAFSCRVVSSACSMASAGSRGESTDAISELDSSSSVSMSEWSGHGSRGGCGCKEAPDSQLFEVGDLPFPYQQMLGLLSTGGYIRRCTSGFLQAKLDRRTSMSAPKKPATKVSEKVSDVADQKHVEGSHRRD